jgi:hypothetical protein
MRRGLFVSTSIACLLSSSVASAEVRRVALLNPDAELLRSASIALSPWAVQVVSLQVPPLARSLPEAAVQARDLASTLAVGAIVWVSVADTTSAVWVYDAETQRVSSRVQAQVPPFDAPGAAAVALSLKTLLRATDLAPQAERFGAASAPPRMRWPGFLRLEVAAGARLFAASETEPWLLLGAVLWPEGDRGGWGLSVHGAVTTGASVAADSLSGVVREVALSMAVRRWVPLGDALALVPFAGASMRVTWLDATVVGRSEPVAVTRATPSLDAGVALPLRLLGPLDVAPYVGASYLLRYQRYLVAGAVAFEEWPVSFEFGAQATTTVF